MELVTSFKQPMRVELNNFCAIVFSRVILNFRTERPDSSVRTVHSTLVAISPENVHCIAGRVSRGSVCVCLRPHGH